MNRNQLLRRASVLWVAGALAAACSPTTAGPTMPAPSDLAPTGGNHPPPDLAMATAAMLPFVVDTVFVSSGFMGDGAMPGAITMTPAKTGDSTDCNGKRASTSALGSCHIVGYTPPASGGMGWAGVYWQYPANNWGMKAGYAIPAGAKKVTFQAKGQKGGEKVTFLAGGIIGAANPYTDSVKATTMVTLTADWAPYTIDLSGQGYTQVLGGFGWTMAATDAGTSAGFFVDDIEWR
jgi:hypothetical protein